MTIKPSRRHCCLSILLWAALMAFSATAWSQVAGKITHLAGTLYAQKKGASIRQLVLNAEVEVGDQLTTDKGSFAQVTFPDGAEILMRPNTRITIDEYSYVQDRPERDSFAFQLLRGAFRAATGLIGKRGNRDAYRAKAIVATIGIRGSVFDALLCQGDCTGGADGLFTQAVQDAHTLANETGTTVVNEGQSFYVKDAKSKPVELPKTDGLGLRFSDAPSDFPQRRPVCAACDTCLIR